LETFFAEHIDCMVVDLRMPGLNGYQLIRALRGDPSTADTPIVILSALAKEEVDIVGLLSGADAYLYKPVEIKVLIQTITQSIAITSEQRRARERAFLADKIQSDD
jgi:DNA-binding response OmpR family regulator